MTPSKPITICFFRNILRVHDNQSLYHALQDVKKEGGNLLPVVCLDPRMMDLSKLNDKTQSEFQPPKTWHFDLERCAAFRTRFTIESVQALKEQLLKHESELLILFGEPEVVFADLKKYLAKHHFTLNSIHTHKEYAFEELQVEKALSKSFHVVYHHDATAVHPSDVNFSFEETSKVYVHFRRRIEKMEHPVRNLLDIPNKLPPFPENIMDYAYCNESGDLLDILYKDAPVKKDSRSAFPWKGGEEAAKERLNSYLFKTGGAASYKETRNGMVGTEYSTKFSVFLAHGCLSPRLVWHELDRLASTRKGKRVSPGSDQDGLYWIKFELLWRDYFRYLMAGNGNKVFHLHGFRKSKQEALEQAKLYDKPNKKPKLSYYDKEWKVNGEHFDKWKTGQTGVPFVDAGMRELLLTGFMNNRSRQNVASYLSKDLELDWRMGAEWFESLLMDHDVYSNYGNWQYVSGVGCDPREGMRHFNIIKQGKDYDPDGEYIRLWCPELEHVPSLFIQAPWLMPSDVQKESKCVIGTDYPKPMYLVETWKNHYPAASKDIKSYFKEEKKKDSKKHNK